MKRTHQEDNPPHLAPKANQGGRHHAKVVATGPTWRAPPLAWPATSPIHVTSPGVHLRRPKSCWFDLMARTCCHMDYGFPTVTYLKPTLGDHLDRWEQRWLPRGGARRRFLAPTRGEWRPPPHFSARHSSSLPCKLLPPEDSLAYKMTPLATGSRKGETKRTQEEAQA